MPFFDQFAVITLIEQYISFAVINRNYLSYQLIPNQGFLGKRHLTFTLAHTHTLSLTHTHTHTHTHTYTVYTLNCFELPLIDHLPQVLILILTVYCSDQNISWHGSQKDQVHLQSGVQSHNRRKRNSDFFKGQIIICMF